MFLLTETWQKNPAWADNYDEYSVILCITVNSDINRDSCCTKSHTTRNRMSFLFLYVSTCHYYISDADEGHKKQIYNG